MMLYVLYRFVQINMIIHMIVTEIYCTVDPYHTVLYITQTVNLL